MNIARTRFLLSFFVAIFIVQPLFAQMLECDIYKVRNYTQTSADAPTTTDFPNGYYFASQVDTAPNVTQINLTTPLTGFIMVSNSSTFFTLNSPYYPSEEDLNTNYPAGAYGFEAMYVDSFANLVEDFSTVVVPEQDLYSTTPPGFLPESWDDMQQAFAGGFLTLSWNPYTLSPGADAATTSLGIFDATTSSTVYSTNLDSSVGSIDIPPNTLAPNHQYAVRLYFSERQVSDGSTNASGVTEIVRFDDLLNATIVTLPGLQITHSGTNIVLTWPAAARFYALKSSTDVALPTASWDRVTDNPTANGAFNVLTLPAAGSQRFFQLVSVPPVGN